MHLHHPEKGTQADLLITESDLRHDPNLWPDLPVYSPVIRETWVPADK
jgi:hypothetical protein